MTAPLTDDERRTLARGFCGPRPGSNYFPLLEIREFGIKIPGERIDALIRAGALVGSPVAGPIQCIKGGDAGPFGEIPDVELSYRYFLATPLNHSTRNREVTDARHMA